MLRQQRGNDTDRSTQRQTRTSPTLSQISHGLDTDRTRTYAVRGWDDLNGQNGLLFKGSLRTPQ